MSNESRFLSKTSGSASPAENHNLTGIQEIYCSKTGFFRILLAKHHGRKVIIKTLKQEFAADPVAITQIKKEFSVLFPLDSLNIARALQLIEIDNTPAIEMEWCDGTDVRQLLNNDIEAADALQIVQGVLNGLDRIHRAGIIHRDLKPENIIFDPYRKVVKIIDFGCAYATGAFALQGPNGTPGYTPESKTTQQSEAEPKDDLYALGIVINELAAKIKPKSKIDRQITRILIRFAETLINGQFISAQAAGSSLSRLLKKRSSGQHIAIATAIILALTLITLLYLLFIRKPAEKPIEQNTQIQTASSTPSAPAPPAENSTQTSPAQPHKEKPQNQSTNNTALLLSETDNPFELAIYAGKLLRDAEAPDAPLSTLMDAFVINFCDSVCLVDKPFHDFPRYLSETEMRSKAKLYTKLYLPKLEKEFKLRFGQNGSSSRRAIMLEGRFYGILLTYHHNPYYKTDTIRQQKSLTESN